MTHDLRKGIALPLLIAILALVFVAGGGIYIATWSEPQEIQREEEITLEEEAVMKKDSGEMMENMPQGEMEEGGGMSMKGPDVMMEKDAMMEKYEGIVLAGASTPLLDFKKADYDKAFASGKLVVLYFYANWCPICKAEFPKMQQAFDELKTDKVIGFRVNYNDSETDAVEKDLAREFGVAYQHTKVFLKNMERVLKSPEGWDKDRYLKEINKFISGL